MSAGSITDVRRVERHMGTVISLQADHAPESAVDRFFDEIRALEQRFSRFRRDSEVMRLERDALALDDASPQVREVLVRCEVLRSATRGAFDHRPVVGGRRVLDPNAVAKGWIIEQALVHLQLAGVSSYFVNAGGDVVVGAPPPERSSWRVGIVHPDAVTDVFARVDLDHAAVATSGHYERGRHIRRTTTGDDALTSVSVVGPELAMADALATAVFAGGEPRPSWWPEDSGYGIITLLTSGRVLLTENLADSVHLGGATHVASI